MYSKLQRKFFTKFHQVLFSLLAKTTLGFWPLLVYKSLFGLCNRLTEGNGKIKLWLLAFEISFIYLFISLIYFLDFFSSNFIILLFCFYVFLLVCNLI